jgi:hypothetical protein
VSDFLHALKAIGWAGAVLAAWYVGRAWLGGLP